MEDAGWWEAVLEAQSRAESLHRVLGNGEVSRGDYGAVVKRCQEIAEKGTSVLKRRDLDASMRQTVLDLGIELMELGDLIGRRVATPISASNELYDLLLHRNLDLRLCDKLNHVDKSLDMLAEEPYDESTALSPEQINEDYAELVEGALLRQHMDGDNTKTMTRSQVRDNLDSMSRSSKNLAGKGSTLNVPFDSLDFERVIGSGRFGKVVSARLRGNPVAVKVVNDALTSNLSTSSLFEITGEMARWSSLDHPNVVRLIGTSLDTEGGRLCFVMELCETTLESLLYSTIPREHALELDAICQVAKGIADGLAYLHSKSVVHLDVKPGNVLLKESRLEYAFVKLCDFGLSVTKTEAGENPEQDWGGTPGYMSPELFLKPPCISARADVFALGMVIYEMMERTQPFEGLDMIEMITATKEGTRPEFSSTGRYPQWLSDLVKHCWEKDFMSRPTAESVSRELEKGLTFLPEVSPPQPPLGTFHTPPVSNGVGGSRLPRRRSSSIPEHSPLPPHVIEAYQQEARKEQELTGRGLDGLLYSTQSTTADESRNDVETGRPGFLVPNSGTTNGGGFLEISEQNERDRRKKEIYLLVGFGLLVILVGCIVAVVVVFAKPS